MKTSHIWLMNAMAWSIIDYLQPGVSSKIFTAFACVLYLIYDILKGD